MEEAKEMQDMNADMNAKANVDADTHVNTDAEAQPAHDTDTDGAAEPETGTNADTTETPDTDTGTGATEITDKAADTGSDTDTDMKADTDESAEIEAAADADTGAEQKPEEEEQENEFTELMKDYDLKTAKAASRISGKIIDIINDKVVVDIGQKTEGILNIQELYDWDGSLRNKVGDTITVICKNINITEGYITVSKKQVDLQDGWQQVRRAYERKHPISGRIVGVLDDNKGFKVDMGVEMFLPMSQADIKKVKSPKKLLGREYQFKVTRLNSREKNGVVSRRVILEEEKEAKIQELFNSLQVGDIIKGKVTSLTDYGAFVDIGGMDGLIHKDNISYARVNHPKERLRKGDEVEAKVLEMNPGNKRISLGIKQRYPDPWIDIAKKYPVGKKLIAKVTKIVSFGAFIELEEGVEGLLHISDLTWEGKTNSVEEFVAVGERLWVQVIELNPEEKKIKLGLKQLEMRPEEKYIQKHKAGEIIKGLVKKILKSRVFVELEKGVEGVVKISDITYFRIDSPHEYLKEKETIDVMILSEALDPNYKVKLGIKQLSDNEWKEYTNKNKPGTVVPIKIKKVTDKGISVEISKNIEGFIRPNEIDDKKLEFEDIKKLYPSGKAVEAMVLNSDFDRKRIYLSIRASRRKREREDIDRYSKSANETVTTIGDLFENAIDKKK
ncbi:MAG: S1 RNA-binding domain-containing protein [Candidatus Aminicenantes bacterium]|nr:MAG: S1 RNA-binding domain-containing protein [Candidatus Aminicenantes bacterium]